jgi:hypothetical protein
MVALFDNETGLPVLRGETLGDGQAGKTGTDDEAVDASKHGAWSVELGAWSQIPAEPAARSEHG